MKCHDSFLCGGWAQCDVQVVWYRKHHNYPFSDIGFPGLQKAVWEDRFPIPVCRPFPSERKPKQSIFLGILSAVLWDQDWLLFWRFCWLRRGVCRRHTSAKDRSAVQFLTFNLSSSSWFASLRIESCSCICPDRKGEDGRLNAGCHWNACETCQYVHNVTLPFCRNFWFTHYRIRVRLKPSMIHIIHQAAWRPSLTNSRNHAGSWTQSPGNRMAPILYAGKYWTSLINCRNTLKSLACMLVTHVRCNLVSTEAHSLAPEVVRYSKACEAQFVTGLQAEISCMSKIVACVQGTCTIF